MNHQTHPMSCWAASAVMITARTEAEIPEQFTDFGADAANEPECRDLADRLGLTVLPEACRASDGWWQLLLIDRTSQAGFAPDRHEI